MLSKHDIRSSLVLVLLAALQWPLPADAQKGGGRMGRMDQPGAESAQASGEMSSDGVERRNRTVVATGLKPSFPPALRCEPISSPYGSPTRYDGSQRRDDRNSGLHGGIDLTLKEGTPLLAVADGEVIASGEGGRLEGFFIWLRHSPENSGLPFWTFTKYQHLSKLPELAPGTKVVAGQTIALSGGTGTTGGHYGAAGYPHLHLTTVYAPGPRYSMRGQYLSLAFTPAGVTGDPLLFYRNDLDDFEKVRSYSGQGGSVEPAVADDGGLVHPGGARRLWPVSCRRS